MEKEQLVKALEDARYYYQYETFEELSKQAVREYPTQAFGYYYLSESLLLVSPARYQEAEVCLAKALEIEPDNIEYMVHFGLLKEQQGSLDDAQIIWGKILKKDVKNVTALIAKANFQIRQYQNYQQGIDLLNQAIQLDPKNLPAYLYRAEAFNGIGLNDNALSDVNLVLEQHETFNEVAILLKITILKDLEKVDETFSLYEQILATVNDNYIHYFNYGLALFDLGIYAKAAEQLEQAVELVEEKHSMFYRTLGEAHLKASQIKEAVVALEQCIELDPTEKEAFLMLIEAKAGLNKYEEALGDIQKLLENVGEDKSLMQRALLLKGKVYLDMGKLQEAEQLFTPIAKEKSLNQSEAFYGLGVVYNKQGFQDKAYRFMKAAKAAKHPLASTYINTQLKEFLQDIKERSLKAVQPVFSQNAASPFLQKIIGKLWKFYNLKSQKLADFPAEYADKIRANLALFSILITEKGAVLVGNDQEELLTYRIKKETSSGMLIEFLPLDNFPSFIAKLKLTDDGLVFSREEKEIIYLKEQSLSTLSTELKTNFNKKLSKEKLLYLGEKGAAILDALF